MRTTQRLLFAILAFPLLLASCGESLITTPPGFGVVEGQWNNVGWNGYGWAVLVTDTLFLTGRRDVSGSESQEVRVKVPFNGVGTYQLNATNSSIALIVGNDGVTQAPATGQFVVSQYDGFFVVGNMNMTAQLPSGTVTFAGRRFDMPVFFSFADVPQLPI